jgi:hypothetical protein
VKCSLCRPIMSLNTLANLQIAGPVSPVERLRFPPFRRAESLGSKHVELRPGTMGKSTYSRLQVAARYVLVRLGCPCGSTESLVKSLATF